MEILVGGIMILWMGWFFLFGIRALWCMAFHIGAPERLLGVDVKPLAHPRDERDAFSSPDC